MWETFRFYHDTLTGWRYVKDGVTEFEVIPTNGRPGSWDLMERQFGGQMEWVGETFASPEEAQQWAVPS